MAIREQTFPFQEPALICSTGSFSISGVPSGVSVSWSTNNSSGLSISSSGSVTRVGSFSGSVDVIATLSTSCGSTTVTKKVWVGNPDLDKRINGAIASTTPVSAGNLYNLTAASGSPGTTFTYNNYTGSGNMTIDLYSPNSADTQMYVYSTSTSGSRHVRVTATNTCGSYYQDFVFYLMGGSIMAYPNPAKDILTLEFSNPDILEALPDQILLFNENSTKSVKTISIQDIYNSKSFKNGGKIELDVSSLSRGTYYLHVTSDKKSKQKIEKIRILLE